MGILQLVPGCERLPVLTARTKLLGVVFFFTQVMASWEYISLQPTLLLNLWRRTYRVTLR